MLTSLLPHRLRTRVLAARHSHVAREVLDTPPIEPADDGVVLFSMIGTAVLLPYLVAVKSLRRQVGRGRVAILDDGTLTPEDRRVLARHCGDPEVFSISGVDTGEFPKGGCWERLLTILDRRSDEYWIQLDSDTVTTGPVPEVAAAVAANRSFTLMGGEECPVEPMSGEAFAARLYPEGPKGGHVQVQIESRMASPATADLPYLRGCAGFAGFARGGDGRRTAARVAAAMTELVGREAMAIWGTEQVASSYVVANDPDPVGLPPERYINYWGTPVAPAVSFLHFVGTHRYDNGAYAKATRDAIAALRA